MDDTDVGMSMMLSAIASPIDEDDTPWQFPIIHGTIKEEVLDSAAQSPSSSLFEDVDDSSSSSISSPTFQCDSAASSLSSFDLMMNMFPDPTTTAPVREEKTAIAPIRKPVLVRKRARECSMVCWLFRTLLTSEYRALPLNAIFEIFEETLQASYTTGQSRHYRQSIRHSLMTSAVFVRVLTPNPRKDFLVMNEQGSWWTVHPDCELACAEHVFRAGMSHRCPPNASIPAYYSRIRAEDSRNGRSSTSSSGMTSPCSSPSESDDVRPKKPKVASSHPYMSTGRSSNPVTGPTLPKTTPQLLNPRSILLNDIDHEEEVL